MLANAPNHLSDFSTYRPGPPERAKLNRSYKLNINPPDNPDSKLRFLMRALGLDYCEGADLRYYETLYCYTLLY